MDHQTGNPFTLEMYAHQQNDKNLPLVQRPKNYLIPPGERKMPIRGTPQRPSSALSRPRPQSQFSAACSMISLKQRKVYLVDFNAVVAKATGCPLKVAVSPKPQLSLSPEDSVSPLPVCQTSPNQSSPVQPISNESSPLPPLIKYDHRTAGTIQMDELLQMLKIKQSPSPAPVNRLYSMGSSYKDTESLPESASQIPIKNLETPTEVPNVTSHNQPEPMEPTREEMANEKSEENEVITEIKLQTEEISESQTQPVQPEIISIQSIEPIKILPDEINRSESAPEPVETCASSKTPVIPSLTPPERPPRPKLRSSPSRKPPERPPFPRNIPSFSRKPPEKPPYPSHLLDTFLPKGETALVNLTQFLEDRPVDKSDRYLGSGVWSPTFSEDSLQWGEPCLRRRPRVPPRPRFMAGSHGDVNLSVALSDPPPSNFAKSIDNMHLCDYISQSIVREGILASVEALQQAKSPLLSTNRSRFSNPISQLDSSDPNLSFLSPRIQRRRSYRQSATRGRSMDDDFYAGSPKLGRHYLDEDFHFRF